MFLNTNTYFGSQTSHTICPPAIGFHVLMHFTKQDFFLLALFRNKACFSYVSYVMLKNM